MADALPLPEVSLFLSLVKLRRFDDATLGVLRTVLVSRDVKSAVQARSSLEQFMRFQSLCILREIVDKNVVHVLSVLEFLVRAFAIIGDVESCLALRYEALVFRENRCGSHQWLQVGHIEWVNFAKDALDNGFYPIARKACENALLCLWRSNNSGMEDFTGDIQRIVILKDIAIASTGSCSVQAKAVKYLKGKEMEKSKQQASTFREIQPVASVLFRESIRKRNARKFSECRTLKSIARSSHTSIH